MGKKKIIENYQLIEVVAEAEGRYEIIKAKHLVQKQYYTLKKVKIKNDKNNKIYDGFLNEASLLKGIKHPNISKSIKMMKTATSIYVVYDYCDGQVLSEWMEKGYKKSILQKQSIIKQICLVLAQMRKAGISHLSLNPQCIFVSEQGDVKVTDFMHGTVLPQNQQEIQLQIKVPKSQYTAPQVKKGTACFESDIYSFGKIIDFMEFQSSKKGTLLTKQFNIKCEQYNMIVRNTIKKKPLERDNIQEVYKNIFKKKGKLRKLQSMSMSLSKLSGKQSTLSRSSQLTGGPSKTDFVKNLILKLLKRRNMAKLLVDIFRNLIKFPLPNATNCIILSTLLLKKSTILMNSIGKFIKYGKGISEIELNQKQRSRFFKSADYFKLQPLLDKEVKFQKKQFQTLLESIYLDNVKILQNKKFNTQLKKEELDQAYFREMIKTFTAQAISQINLQTQNPLFARSLLTMSMFIQNGGVQLFFEKKVSTYPTDLMEQPIFIKIFKEIKVKQILIELEKYKSASNPQKAIKHQM